MQLRNYQRESVDAVIRHFRESKEAAVVVLPTGAGKSLVIAELARIARHKVLVLTHVKELVEQNADKIQALGQSAGIYSAGLKRKDTREKVLVASIQSAARNLEDFSQQFSLVVIDECHRASEDDDSQYQSLLKHLKKHNPALCLLGLTATPYRLDSGWVYQRHYHGVIRSDKPKPFGPCLFELPLRHLIKKGYLTPPLLYDGVSIQYDFQQLSAPQFGDYPSAEIDKILSNSGRATTQIIDQVQSLAAQRKGVIIFAASVRHGREILKLLKGESAAFICADTSSDERAQIIDDFKASKIKYLINVSVLTTGFDAPHVDLIAILRPTASVSLYQQMVGRGLRLDEGKSDCLVVDYAANGFDLYAPEIGEPRPNPNTVPVQVPCPECGFANVFWGKCDRDGDVIEHYGRRCQGETPVGSGQQCQFRFRSRVCPDCGAENDIAARQCQQCQSTLVDPDKHLSQVLKRQHHHLFRCTGIQLLQERDAKGRDKLVVVYLDEMANEFKQSFIYDTPAQKAACYHQFIKTHLAAPGTEFRPKTLAELVAQAHRFRFPDLLLLHKQKRHWSLVRAMFDYRGRYRTSEAAD
ncbi:DEAD/DEAH box helicase [Paraferrimonas sedimenticola]|uniref:Helicase n=1 Tax=Paraferrimonas sedimenticola TaxID=375674 RepID=A0AA37W040_9GAMM|nr:DEAD/DEAH box helicase [Paraferrimonas sedimenticola]GLP97961.1 helicase [Paraferrimonas sedimenticola]